MKTFGIFRICFGLYLLWHFASLVPYGQELFTTQGILTPDINPYFGTWPNPLFLNHSTAIVTPLLLTACVCALLYTVGCCRRVSSLLLWFILTCTFTANPLIANPSLPYIGLILIFSTLIPNGESYRLGSKPDPQWKMPALILTSSWILLATGYTFSGLLKLGSPSWIDGTAISHLLNNPLARNNILRDLTLALPVPLLKIGTWLTLSLEILFLPLCLSKKTRPWIWLALVMMHIGIIALVDFADLSIGMILFHLFTTPESFRNILHPIPASGKLRHLLFIDGDCIFCQNTAKVLIRHDHENVLTFAPLQGKTAEKFLPEESRKTTNQDGTPTGAVILVENPGTKQEKHHSALNALLRTLFLTGGPPTLLYPLVILPQTLKNHLYNIIARNRHHLHHLLPKNSRNSCSLPDAANHSRFLP